MESVNEIKNKIEDLENIEKKVRLAGYFALAILGLIWCMNAIFIKEYINLLAFSVGALMFFGGIESIIYWQISDLHDQRREIEKNQREKEGEQSYIID